MKIVLVRSNPVAPYPRLEKMASSLYEAGHDVQVLGWDRNSSYNIKKDLLELNGKQIAITRFGIKSSYGGGIKKNLFPLITFQLKLIKWFFINRKKYDSIHAYDLDTGFISLILAKMLNKKIVYDIADYYVDSHNLKETSIGRLVKKLENYVVNRADAVIICTEFRRKQIEGTKPKNLTIIHNSPILNYKNNDFTLKSASKRVLRIAYVGILAENRFLREALDVISSRSDCELHIGGFGELEELIQKADNEYSNIHYYGKIKYEDTLSLEEQCDVLLAIYDPNVPNHYYAAPNKFYESLALGKPVIMAKNTGMDNVIRENEIGEVIEYSVKGLSKGIDKIIKRRNEWDSISTKSKKIFNESYSWDEMNHRIVELYQKIQK